VPLYPPRVPPPWISIVIPTYNEQAAIGDVVTAARSWLENSGRDWEIIVVDNASEDGTCEAVAPFLEERVVLLRNEVNRGKGFSIQRGMLEAHGELRLMCDAVRDVRGAEPTLRVENWLGDTASFGEKVPTVIFGPGGPPVYCPDEHLTVEDIHEATKVYAAFAALALSDPASG